MGMGRRLTQCRSCDGKLLGQDGRHVSPQQKDIAGCKNRRPQEPFQRDRKEQCVSSQYILDGDRLLSILVFSFLRPSLTHLVPSPLRTFTLLLPILCIIASP